MASAPSAFPEKVTQAYQYFTKLWPQGVPEGQRLLLWTLPDKRSYWLSDLGEASELAVRLAPNHDVYCGIGAGRMPKRDAARRRLKASEVLTLSAFAADFDIAGPGRKKKNLFRSGEEILDLIRDLPHEPTMMVHSGWGIQTFWCFKIPLELATEARRSKVEAMSRGWGKFLQSKARERGRELDAV